MTNIIAFPNLTKTELVADTGVWIDFDYSDTGSYPKETEAYFVNDGYGAEILALWDNTVQVWMFGGDTEYFVAQWLLEECR